MILVVCLGFVHVVMLTVASAVVASAVSEAWVDSGRLEADGDSSEDELASVLAGASVDDTTSVGDATSVVDATSVDAAAVEEATSAVDTADADAEADGNATPWEVSFLAQEQETGLLAYPRKIRN